MRKRQDDEDGAAAVEFALLFVPFMILIFGIVEFSFYFLTAETTNSAARETARRVVVGDCWGSGRTGFTRSHAPRMTAVGVSPNPDSLDVGQEVTVTVTSNALLTGFFPFLPGTVTREYKARMEKDEPSAAADDTCTGY